MSRDWQNSLCDWRHSLSSIRDAIMYYYVIHYNTQTLIYRPRGRGFCNPLPRGLLSKMLFPEKNDFSRKVIVL